MIKNLIIRSVSGIIMAAILIAALLLTDTSGFIVLALVGTLSVYEFLKNINKSGKSNTMIALTCINSVIISLLLFMYLNTNESYYLAIIVPLIIVRFCVELFRAKPNPIQSISYEIFALVYTLLPMLLLTLIDGIYVVAILILVWANDVGAYFVGVTFGRHKLCERLSPKKSWEGFWGGVIFAALAAFILSYFVDGDFVPFNLGGSTISWIITGVVISLSAVTGDLFESMFKRSIDVKDSGNMIPGHGGILDRFDAMFFAAPIFYMIYTFILK